MKVKFFVVFCLLASQGFTQDLTGIWRGSFNSSDKILKMLSTEDRYKLEVQIDQRARKFTGITYSYKTSYFYGKAVANGTVNPQTGKVMLEELKIVEVKMMDDSRACVMTYFLQYSKNGNEEFLEGWYSSYGEKDSIPCGKGTVVLRKVTTSDFYKEPFLERREKEIELAKSKVSPPPVKKTMVNPPLAKTNTKSQPVTPKPSANKPITVPGSAKPAVAKSTPKASGPKMVPGQQKTSTPVAGTPNKSPAAKGIPGKVVVSPPVAKATPKSAPKAPTPGVARGDERPLTNKSIEAPGQADSMKKPDPWLKKPVVVDVPKPLATRENELVKTIVVNSNHVSINIYDNGTIDGDTVSVYLDKKLVVSRQLLTTKPISLNLELDESRDHHELVMVAENLGTIPPNTSLMVVKAGDKQYEVRISSTEQKNAVVIFKFESLED